MHCLVLAGGGNNPGDPLYAYSQGAPKALLPIGEHTLLEWVVGAIQESRYVDEVIVIGIDKPVAQAAGLRFRRPVHFLSDQGGMVANMRAGTDYIAQQWPEAGIILGASADIPTITGAIVDDFIERCEPWDKAVYYTFVSRQTMEARFPGSNRTYTQLADMEVAGGDMSMAQVGILKQSEPLVLAATNARKHPWQVARLVGLRFLLRFIFGRVTLAEVEATASRALGQPVAVLLSPHAELAMDADKPDQVDLLRRELTGHTENS
jgi:GTP:adenosylcobinamide-phosphate guanylyltransferase